MLDPAQQSSLQQFEKQSARYGKGHILSDTSDLVHALKLSPVRGGRALDVATGGGHTAVFLAKNGFEVTASDLAPAMLEATGKLAAENGVSIVLRNHPAEKFPDPEETYDLVSCRVAAHHFSSVIDFLAQTWRALRTGGVFLLIDGTVPDHAPEAETWIHQVEKLRDPSHKGFLTPNTWKMLCYDNDLQVLHLETTPFLQPDLNWYFETAGTPEANRKEVLQLVANAPGEARKVFGLREKAGKITWHWPRLLLIAQKVPRFNY